MLNQLTNNYITSQEDTDTHVAFLFDNGLVISVGDGGALLFKDEDAYNAYMDGATQEDGIIGVLPAMTPGTKRIKTEFLLSSHEIEEMKKWPSNLPGASERFVGAVNELYFDLFDTPDTADLYKEEEYENWPSGAKVTKTEAQRMILQAVLFFNDNHKTITPAEMNNYRTMHRESWIKVMDLMYE